MKPKTWGPTIGLRLPLTEDAALRSLAASRGLKPAELARERILQFPILQDMFETSRRQQSEHSIALEEMHEKEITVLGQHIKKLEGIVKELAESDWGYPGKCPFCDGYNRVHSKDCLGERARDIMQKHA